MKKNFSLFAITTLITLTSQAQIISTLTGNGQPGDIGDGGKAINAQLRNPFGLTVDSKGNIYIADAGNNVIRKIDTSGVISTVAGKGYFFSGYKGDGGAATSAQLNSPSEVTFDSKGNMYIADTYHNVIRKVNTSGIISTVAGNGTQGYTGDGGAATSAELHYPYGVAVDAKGNLYIADRDNHVIRKVNTSGIISTFAGKGTEGFSGDGSAAASAELGLPFGIALDTSGNLYIADYRENNIRKVDTKGIISSVAGNGSYGVSGDGGPATNAFINGPEGIVVDAKGNFYIAEYLNNVIRFVNTSGIISTIAGNGTKGYTGDGGLPTNAQIANPEGIAVDSKGNIYFSDSYNHLVRKMTKGALPVTISNIAAIQEKNEIVIKWQTAIELNSSHFIIQHSTNGNSYTDIGTTKSIGIGANSYLFKDNSPVRGVNYYRLKSVDKDGANDYSKVVSCEWAEVSQQLWIFPNPSKNKIIVKANHISSLEIVNNTGKLVKVVSLKDATNPNLDVSNLPVGVYHLRIKNTDGKINSIDFVKD